MHKKYNYYCILLLLIILVSFTTAFASKVTIDADGGAMYTSFDAALLAMYQGSDWDTVEFIGSDQDSFPMN